MEHFGVWNEVLQHFGDLYSYGWVIETLMSGPVPLVTVGCLRNGLLFSNSTDITIMANRNSMFY